MTTLLLLALCAPCADAFDLVVKETAGIRRFGYPVKVKLELKADLTGKEGFQLLSGGKAVAAQFRPAGKRAVWLDFNVNQAPLASQKFRVEYGADVKAGPEGKAAMSVKEDKGAFEVRSGGMRYAVPAGLEGLFSAVSGGKSEYIKPGSKGLWLETDKGRVPIKGLKGRIVRQGPMACALEFTGEAGGLPVKVELTFPRSKSWAEVSVAAKGAKALGADLKLELSSPALVDFGAGTGVYVALKKGQRARLKAHLAGLRTPRQAWETSVGPKDDLKLYVVATPKSPPAEGWAHAMDRQRCTALAVERFGLSARHDQIDVDAAGGLRLAKDGEKGLRFWLHFVPMPVQVGAVTSPQAMLAPLVVEVK